MPKSVRMFLGVVLLLVLLSAAPVRAQDGAGFEFFDATKHNVQGAFLTYFQSLPNPNSVLGFPLTEQFLNSDGTLVQYFQRARLELVAGQVKLTPLGVLTYKSGVQLKINNSLACRNYDTGFSVCFAFLEFFDANGGLGFFGYPISPFEYQDNMIVQYFQNGRMEWHPSNPEGQRVVMGDLGTAYFYSSGEDLAWLDPAKPANGITEVEVVSLNVRAFPWKAVTYSTDQQLIFVVVQDQTLQPVRDATGEAKVTWTNGRVETLTILTGDSGIATLSLPVVEETYGGLVTVDVQVKRGQLHGHTTTSFRIWY